MADQNESRVRTSETPNMDDASALSASEGKIREGGYGKSTDLELASLDNQQSFQDLNAGSSTKNASQMQNRNFEFGDLGKYLQPGAKSGSDNASQNQDQNYEFGNLENTANQSSQQSGLSSDSTVSEMNRANQLQNEYSQELSGAKTGSKDEFHLKDKYQR